MVNISVDVTDLGGEARPGDKVVFWRPRMGGSATHAGRVISTAPVTVFLTDGKATVSDVEPGEMTVLLQCRGVESQGPVTVGVPDGNGTVTLRSLIESQFTYAPPIVSAVQEAAANASASERAAIEAQVRSEAAADRADAKVDDAINNGANLVRNEVKQDADRAVSARQAATQSESNAKASENAAATSASNAATSETNAKQSETNAGDYAAVATTAATEAVDAMDSVADIIGAKYATQEYVNTATGKITSRVNALPTLAQTTSIAFGAAAALSGESGTPAGDASGQWDESKPITLWGDSSIDRGEPGQRLADGINNALRQDVVDNSVGGTTLDNALLRMGGIRLWVTPEGGKIPTATTPVMLDLHGADVGMMSGGKVPMMFAGVKGTFEYSNTVEGGGFVGARFTRDVAGTEVTVSSPTLLESRTQFDPYATHIIVSGGNDKRAAVKTVPEDDLRGHLVAGYVRMVEMIAASPTKHVLIGGVKGRGDTEIGDWYHKLIMEVNNWLKQLYPHIFVDRNRWLCEHAPRLLNIELSDEDKRRAEAWLPPKAVLQDATHTVPELRVIEGENLWAPELAIRGWAQATKPLERAPMDITNRVPYDMQQRITDLENRLNALEP